MALSCKTRKDSFSKKNFKKILKIKMKNKSKKRSRIPQADMQILLLLAKSLAEVSESWRGGIWVLFLCTVKVDLSSPSPLLRPELSFRGGLLKAESKENQRGIQVPSAGLWEGASIYIALPDLESSPAPRGLYSPCDGWGVFPMSILEGTVEEWKLSPALCPWPKGIRKLGC